MTNRISPERSKPEVLDDGFGSRWQKCERPDCALEIVRPGKVQCCICEARDRAMTSRVSKERLKELDCGDPRCDDDVCLMARELESLREDAERLDWLESRYSLHGAADILYVVDGYQIQLTKDDGFTIDLTVHDETLRDAIDRAALAAQQEEPS